MKQLFIFLLAAGLAFSAAAQTGKQPHHGDKDKKHPKIETLVPDLSATQRTRIDVVTRRSAQVIDGYRSQIKAVRDSIRLLMESPEDKSAVLFPLFEREGKLKSEISKEYYRTRVAIDKVLTPAQRDTLREKMAKQREQQEKGRKK